MRSSNKKQLIMIVIFGLFMISLIIVALIANKQSRENRSRAAYYPTLPPLTTPTPTPTSPPIRPALCQSATISSQAIQPGQSFTITSTANVNDIKRFTYAFYNVDNLFPPPNGTPKPICVANVGQEPPDPYCPAGSHRFVISDSFTTVRQSNTHTFSYSDIDIQDYNWSGQKPVNFQVNAYFTNSLGQFSAPEGNCVVRFSLSGSPSPTPTPSGPTPTPDPQSSATLKFKLILPDISAGSAIQSSYFITAYQNGQEVSRNGPFSMQHVQDTTEVYTDDNGVVITGITNGTYSLLIKEEHTIMSRFDNVVLSVGQTLDCTNTVNNNCGDLSLDKVNNKPLLAGDADGHNTTSGSYNRVDIADFARYLYERLVNNAGRTTDFNLDDQINTADLGILARNFNQVGD